MIQSARSRIVPAEDRRTRPAHGNAWQATRRLRGLFVERGYHATRPQESPGSPMSRPARFYTHFTDKREAFLAFVAQAGDELTLQFAEQSASGDFRSVSRIRLQALLAYNDSNPGVLAAAFSDPAMIDGESKPVKGMREGLAQSLALGLERGKKDGTASRRLRSRPDCPRDCRTDSSGPRLRRTRVDRSRQSCRPGHTFLRTGSCRTRRDGQRTNDRVIYGLEPTLTIKPPRPESNHNDKARLQRRRTHAVGRLCQPAYRSRTEASWRLRRSRKLSLSTNEKPWARLRSVEADSSRVVAANC